MTTITYSFSKSFDLNQAIELYKVSFIESPRPVDDPQRMEKLFQESSLLCIAYDGDILVGICRALSDFSYVTYISDLAVHPDYSKLSIGKTLLKHIQNKSGDATKLVLLSNTTANTYYPHIGFKSHPRAWVRHRDINLNQ